MHLNHEFKEESKFYQGLKETEDYAKKIKLNYKIRKLMVFIPARTKYFYLRFIFIYKELQILEETKLLGLILRSYLSWSSKEGQYKALVHKKGLRKKTTTR